MKFSRVPVRFFGDGLISWLWQYLALAFMTLVYGSYGMLINLSKENGRLSFNPQALVLLTELLKFIITIALWQVTGRCRGSFVIPPIFQMLPFAVPALLYTINNNLSVIVLLYMDPATYQVLGNFKIVTTAVVYRLVLKKPLRMLQYVSIGLLTLAGVTNSVGSMASAQDIGSNKQYITWQGALLILIHCVISALAGVYTEFIFKRNMKMSLFQQNLTLYCFGIFFSALSWFASLQLEDAQLQTDTGNRRLLGFSGYVWLVAFTQALNGLGMSVVLKYNSNLTRLFIISSAMVISTTLSIFVLHIQLTVFYFVTLTQVLSAIALYYR